MTDKHPRDRPASGKGELEPNDPEAPGEGIRAEPPPETATAGPGGPGELSPAADDPPAADLLAAEPEARIAALEAELEAARAEAAENRDRWLRAAADLENFRRRAARDLEESVSRGRAEVLLDVVTVLDDVDRALASMGEAESAGDPVLAGIHLIRARLEEMLRRHGVTEIEAEGRIFDPHVHEAVLQVPASDVPDGCVAQVLQRGYWFGERVLRPAKVAVACMQQHA